MKKISLILVIAGMVWAIQPANAQNSDTTKNRIEIKKKVKTGVNGRKVTKIKMEGNGTPSAISGAADGAVTGKLPTPAPVVVTPPPAPVPAPVPVVETPAPAPAPAPAPTVVVVTAPQPEKPETPKTTITTTTETKQTPVVASHSTHTIRTTKSAHPTTAHVYHKTYKKPAVASSTKTTTTVQKSE